MIPLSTLRTVGIAVGGLLALALLVGVTLWVSKRFSRPDPLSATIARQDEKTASRAATAIGASTDAANRDATINIDLTTKDIRDAFQAVPLPQPTVGGEPRPLPTAPVERLRDRINASVARANRAAGPASATD